MANERPNAKDIIAELDLAPHPEGGWYRETFRDAAPEGARAASTAIYYLLEAGDVSAWRRVDAAEVWHFYAGDPLVLTISENGHDARSVILGLDFATGARPQRVVPPGAWQTAETLGRWTLVGCTVAPGFEYGRFELAPPDWRPTPRRSR
ncbi:MAG: cupin domain-containing protein [Pseudomonadota bacterium]